ncbi:TPA: T6SS effector phospholipase Tle3 domain-containing protein [Pseudomonas aeruginosa]
MNVRNRTVTGEHTAPLAPGKNNVSYVQIRQAKPCIVIVVHGVNDLAGIYESIEQGLCQGLNERLDHLLGASQVSPASLVAARYSLPTAADRRAPNPDQVYYRRSHDSTPRGIVIPFYWGSRESDAVDPGTGKPYLRKDTPHGEWLDRYGNRLDKSGSKEGGIFANATTTLPDMWKQGFSGYLFGVVPLDRLWVSTARHPLFPGPPRNYMVLAAKRLAMLVSLIRKRYPDDTVNVVGHSQGTLLTLLANAFLQQDGQRPIDAGILMNSPYSLIEPKLENTELGKQQQTAGARLDTLANIVTFIGEGAHPTPSLEDLADASNPRCIGGPQWTGHLCTSRQDQTRIAFTERDNRGTVSLYFSPLDQTVGLRNVQGIGWQGVPDSLEQVEVLSRLGPRFHQRVFTTRTREGLPEEVGAHGPGHRYVLRQPGETLWDGTAMGLGGLSRANLEAGHSVCINAAKLPTPLRVNFDGDFRNVVWSSERNGVHQVREAMDPIEASIAVTHKGLQRHPSAARTLEAPSGLAGNALKRYFEEQAGDLNDLSRNPYTAPENNAWAAAWHRVRSMVRERDNRGLHAVYLVTFNESPDEARERLMSASKEDLGKDDALSFHSAIPANPEHSRRAMAYDLALGQARSIDDEDYYRYLCRVADWRLGWEAKDDEGMSTIDAETEVPPGALGDRPDTASLEFYRQENPDFRQLIDATADYYATGRDERYPRYFQAPLPDLIRSEQIG